MCVGCVCIYVNRHTHAYLCIYHHLIFSLSSLLSKFHTFLPMFRRSGCLQSSWLTRGVMGLALKFHLVKEISVPMAFCEALFSWTVVPKPHFCSNSVSSKPNSHTSWHHMHKNNACFSTSSCSVSALCRISLKSAQSHTSTVTPAEN